MALNAHSTRSSLSFCAPLAPALRPSRAAAAAAAAALRRPPPLARVRRRARVSCIQTGPSPPSAKRNRAPEYYANVGTVLDTLRADYSTLLTHAPQLHIFTEHITFSDASGNTLHGKRAYANLLWLLRVQAALFLSAHALRIQSVFHDDGDGVIYIRWRLQFSLRSWTLLSAANGGAFVVDGISLYRLDQRGWVFHHSLENSVRRRAAAFELPRVWVRARSAEPSAAGVHRTCQK